jgi:hypothetical protein
MPFLSFSTREKCRLPPHTLTEVYITSLAFKQCTLGATSRDFLYLSSLLGIEILMEKYLFFYNFCGTGLL